jgi:glutamyl-tRNA synthetase
VTEVLRGEDLLSSTPRQAWLQELLGLPRPRWVHVPLVTDGEGRRLAKRHDALAIAAVREAGVAPERLLAWCARSAGLPVGDEVDASAVASAFDLARLSEAPAAFDDAVLRGLRGPR